MSFLIILLNNFDVELMESLSMTCKEIHSLFNLEENVLQLKSAILSSCLVRLPKNKCEPYAKTYSYLVQWTHMNFYTYKCLKYNNLIAVYAGLQANDRQMVRTLGYIIDNPYFIIPSSVEATMENLPFNISFKIVTTFNKPTLWIFLFNSTIYRRLHGIHLTKEQLKSFIDLPPIKVSYADVLCYTDLCNLLKMNKIDLMLHGLSDGMAPVMDLWFEGACETFGNEINQDIVSRLWSKAYTYHVDTYSDGGVIIRLKEYGLKRGLSESFMHSIKVY